MSFKDTFEKALKHQKPAVQSSLRKENEEGLADKERLAKEAKETKNLSNKQLEQANARGNVAEKAEVLTGQAQTKQAHRSAQTLKEAAAHYKDKANEALDNQRGKSGPLTEEEIAELRKLIK